MQLVARADAAVAVDGRGGAPGVLPPLHLQHQAARVQERLVVLCI